MVIEIIGTGSHNKGAEMMLLTILQQLQNEKVKFTATPRKNSFEYSFYSKLGIYPKLWIRYKNFQLGKLGKFIPKKIRHLYGLITDEEIDVVLDASGFVYSSQWGDLPTKIMAEETSSWKKNGKKIILLPQAFGPFETEDIRKAMRKIIDNVDIIYARDQFSYEELLQLKGDTDKIKLYPDFTILFKGSVPLYFNRDKHKVCIVPNQRMKDKISNSNTYENLFATIILKLQQNNLSPFFLIHGGTEDENLANKINTLLAQKIEIINEENPFYIKGIIRESLGLIGSRYHSLASSLYSGNPTLGMGWSHKYKYLFKDFEFEEGLISSTIPDKELEEKLSIFTNAQKRKIIKEKLDKKKNIYEKTSIDLFTKIGMKYL